MTRATDSCDHCGDSRRFVRLGILGLVGVIAIGVGVILQNRPGRNGGDDRAEATVFNAATPRASREASTGRPTAAAAAMGSAQGTKTPLVAAPSGRGAPTICQSWPMPHEPRGACTHCHALVDCTRASIATALPAVASTAIPTLSRSSLLPHRFAGVCSNCHAIQGPMPSRPITGRTMDSFPLTPTERALVVGGQRVDVPSLLTQIKVPMITRIEMLPHEYVGVCSNCHRVADFGHGAPSIEFTAWAMPRARTMLLSLKPTDDLISHARLSHEHPMLELMQWITGFMALGFFGLSLVYIGFKTAVRANPDKFRGRFNLKKWFTIHEWSSIAFCLTVVFHWLSSYQGNALLHATLGLTLALTFSGLAFRYRLLGTSSNMVTRWLHTQRFLLYAMIILAVVGHLAADV